MGENAQEIHEKYLHTIGNLTFTGYNSDYGNKSFQEKRDRDNGFKQSPLKLNQSLKDLEVFGEKEILDRAEYLANLALKIWVSPKTSGSDKSKKEKEVYDLNSYKFSPYSMELFEILREGIKVLDEKVTEKFNQQYIAYKLKTNFVDIVVQKNYLKLYLNMEFSELQDGKKRKTKDRRCF